MRTVDMIPTNPTTKRHKKCTRSRRLSLNLLIERNQSPWTGAISMHLRYITTQHPEVLSRVSVLHIQKRALKAARSLSVSFLMLIIVHSNHFQPKSSGFSKSCLKQVWTSSQPRNGAVPCFLLATCVTYTQRHLLPRCPSLSKSENCRLRICVSFSQFHHLNSLTVCG